MRSRECRDLDSLLVKLEKASPNRRVDEMLDAARMSVQALDAKLTASHEEARAERLRRERERWDAEKAYEDGYAQGLADGYGECLDRMARHG